jgi:NAD(P)-dependent dehydrogenase (short-subunit alcohol dehydrogenase family)
MTDKNVWLITGAARGMGVDIAKAALTAGHAVVATARNTDSVTAALGQDENLLAVKLDVTDPADAEAAVKAALDRFGRIDVLVNNAGNFYAGFFEELSPEQLRAQIETTLFGPMNVTRAVLPVMRAQPAPGSSSPSPRPPASWARRSAPPMPPPSSGSRAGSSR